MSSLLAHSQIPNVEAGPQCLETVWLIKSPGHIVIIAGRNLTPTFIFASLKANTAESFIGVNQISSLRNHCLSF